MKISKQHLCPLRCTLFSGKSEIAGLGEEFSVFVPGKNFLFRFSQKNKFLKILAIDYLL